MFRFAQHDSAILWDHNIAQKLGSSTPCAVTQKHIERWALSVGHFGKSFLPSFSSVKCYFIMPRCLWATTEPNITYHDQEWGVPVHDDRLLFEFLILEGAQAGLSWTTILKKRDNYRKAFDGFRPEKIARYGKRDVQRLLRDEGIVRNRLKIAATIENAKMFLIVRKEFGTFDTYLWSFVGGKPIQNRWRSMAEVPARSAESEAMSRDLLRRGFKFVGSTICYALMQATGMVNDHLVECYRHKELGGRETTRNSPRKRHS
jgi:DNA-3-methyladenine glycosylase I